MRSVYLGSEFLQNLRGTPLAIYDFGICFMQKPLGGRPLRFMILGFVLCKNFWGDIKIIEIIEIGWISIISIVSGTLDN